MGNVRQGSFAQDLGAEVCAKSPLWTAAGRAVSAVEGAAFDDVEDGEPDGYCGEVGVGGLCFE